MVRIRLFGGVQAASEGGEPLDVGTTRSQTVLAALALSPGSAVPVSRLVELVWGDAPPQAAEKALQWHIAQLRRGLGPATIVRTGAAYRLDVAPDAVDVARFRRYLRDGDIEAALAEWTATPLAGLDAPGLTATVDGLVEQWLGATETDLERQIGSDAQGAIGPLTELSGRYPFREGFWALLMSALYRVGRQADALAAFRRARQQLVDQLGVEPGPRLRELESLILDHDERLRDGERPIGDSQPEPVPQGDLPDRPGGLIGRDDDLVAIHEALARSPVVTLVGPGGIGKTRLALATAGGSGPDVCLVELATIAASSDVPRAVADALGVTQRSGRTLAQAIVTSLRSRPVLLLIDNCEHVIGGAAELVQAIAEGCPRARILATSRERLGVDGEQVLAVGPLDPAAGAELFGVRALAVDRTFDPDAHRSDVAEICRRLDGIPLAIELAAARTRVLRPPDLVARLDDLRTTGARRTGATRHRTLRATIQWSYDLLAPHEQRLFEQLSVFNGQFNGAAAEAVALDPHELDDALATLVERSMLTVVFGPFGRRFRLLETMRQFAAEQLERHGLGDVVAERHARWCLRHVTDIQHLLRGPGEIEGVARLGVLWANLRAGVAWACAAGDGALAAALVGPIATEITLRARQEIGDWIEDILTVTPAAAEELRAHCLFWVAERYVQNGDAGGYARVVGRHGEPDHVLSRYARAYATGDGAVLADCLPRAVADLRARGEDFLAAFIELNSAGTLLGIGRFAEVDACLSALADRYRAQGPPTLRHWALQALAYSASFQGRSGEAEQYFDEAATIDLPEGALSANQLVEARSAFRRGHRSRAFELLGTYIDEQVEVDNVAVAAVVCVEFVNIMAAIDRLAEAAHMLSYLAGANDFGALASRTLVAEAARRIAGSPAGSTPAPTQRLDDRQALAYMRDVLGHLT